MRALLKIGFALALAVPALASPSEPGFLGPRAKTLAAALPPPPAPGSLAAEVDLEAVRQSQAWRTPDVAAWAQTVEKWDLWDFSAVLGVEFAKDRLPLTGALFRRLGEDLGRVGTLAKTRYGRPRPPLVDAGIQPCIPLTASPSYPSGHALFIFMEAEVLASLIPEAETALRAFAHRAAWSRVQGGVHFPSDVLASRRLARAVLAAVQGNPDYKKALEACRAELAGLRVKKAS